MLSKYFRKKVDTIKELTVEKRRCSYIAKINGAIRTAGIYQSYEDAIEYKVYSEIPLTYETNEYFEEFAIEYLSLMDKEFCSDCYWLLVIYGYYELNAFAQNDFVQMTRIEDDWTFLLLSRFDSAVYKQLLDTKYPDGEKMYISIIDISFISFHTKDFTGLESYGIFGYFEKHKMEMMLTFKTHNYITPAIIITHSPENNFKIKHYMKKMFESHDIKLKFVEKE